MILAPTHVTIIVGLSVLVALGCATIPNEQGWGDQAIRRPGWQRVGSAAADAALETRTWAPLAGALIVQIGDIDKEIAEWASERNPIWGSREIAARRSDELLDASQAAYWASVLLTPSGSDGGSWIASKLRGVGVGMVAVGLNHETTELLKDETRRERPDRTDRRSFPSGHASQATVYASLAGRNSRSLRVCERTQVGLEAAFSTLALGCAWSRVEAKKHYPSDVLAGYALGHFLATFLNDALIRTKEPESTLFQFATVGAGMGFCVDVRFP
jgi:hypothetical protein